MSSPVHPPQESDSSHGNPVAGSVDESVVGSVAGGEGVTPVRAGFWRALRAGLCCYCATLPLVLVCILIGHYYLPHLPSNQDGPRIPPSPNPIMHILSRWDGQWHLINASTGYFYNPDRMSSVAFFPAYPILVWAVERTTPFSLRFSGLIVSQFFLIASLVLLYRYIAVTRSPSPKTPLVAWYAMFALMVFPTSFWLRMTYSEPLFLFLCLLSLYGMAKKWPFWIIALIAGAATGTRLVGAALFFVLAWHIWCNSVSWKQTLLRCCWLLPLSLWGIIAYMIFLWVKFDAPLAFSQTQVHWFHRPPGSLFHRFQSVLTLEPARAIFNPLSPAYWRRFDPGITSLIFSPHAMNALIFLAAVIAGLFAVVKRWLTVHEIILSFFLLGIPYISVGYTQYMMSHGRFALTVFPLFIVLGTILSRLPAYVSIPLLAAGAWILGVFSSMLASGGYYIL